MNFYLKEGDTSPPLRVTVRDEKGNKVDLTGCTATFSMRVKSAGTVKIDAAAATVEDDEVLVYQWQGSDTDTAEIYEGEFDVTYSGGAKETAPNDDYITIYVDESVNT